jgi:hypothetical protein
MDDDENDSTRMTLTRFGPVEQPMTQAQKINAAIPEGYRPQDLAKRDDMTPNQSHMTGVMATFLAKKSLGLDKPKLYDEFGQRNLDCVKTVRTVNYAENALL